ncbi:MAG: hypothetical protein ACOY3Y_12195 [Acidobacteriota bacterium]
MQDEIVHVHKSLDPVETVKVEKNSRGFNYEVKAETVERAMQLIDQLEAQLAGRAPAEK